MKKHKQISKEKQLETIAKFGKKHSDLMKDIGLQISPNFYIAVCFKKGDKYEG